jgi:predicted HicB family RNase H-like nuclease
MHITIRISEKQKPKEIKKKLIKMAGKQKITLNQLLSDAVQSLANNEVLNLK